MNKLNKPSVLFVIPDQFGYSAGYYYYCKYLLKAGFRVGVLCVDMGLEKQSLAGDISVHYLSIKNSFEYRCKLIMGTRRMSSDYDTIIFKQLLGLSLGLFLLNRKKVILDFRTGSVQKGIISFFENIELMLVSRYFKRVFILSHELATKFKIPTYKYIWLPLGADEIAFNKKDYSHTLKLLYVGTFDYRELYKAIEGFALFIRSNPINEAVSFDIIGKGSEAEERKIKNVINKHQLQNFVFLHGYLTHKEASEYFEKCNIGVSFIPMIPCFENQPPTKTYEYILSGLVCIATETGGNKQLINNDNGILHQDTATGFCNALKMYYERKGNYNTDVIKQSLNDYKWESIVNRILIPAIKL